MQEVESESTFDEFVRILEVADHIEALKMLSPDSLTKKQVTTGTKAFYSMAEQLSGNKVKQTNYPLGLQPSGYSLSPKVLNPSKQSELPPGPSMRQFTSNQSPNIMTSLMEKNQATMIKSENDQSEVSFRLSDSSFDDVSKRHSGDYRNSTMKHDIAPRNERVSFSLKQTDNQHFEMFSSPGNSLWGSKLKELYPNRYSKESMNKDLSSFKDLNLKNHESEQKSDKRVGSSDDNESDDDELIRFHPYQESSDHNCMPPHVVVSSDSESSTTSESLVLSSKLLTESAVMALAKEAPTTMYVIPATTCHQDPKEDYKMTSRPRGPCLIINNIDFDSDIFPQRKGSDIDAMRFDDVFKQLGFTTFLHRNQTADQMKSLCKEIASHCEKKHNALFVILLSHGSETGIYGTDGIEVDLHDIITFFDNKHCKAMVGKPKVFVIQACRGRQVDYGDCLDAVPLSMNYSEDRVPFSRMAEFSRKNGKHESVRNDMLFIFSCLAGKFQKSSSI